MSQSDSRQLVQDVRLLKAAIHDEKRALPFLRGAQREIADAGIQEREMLATEKEGQLAGRSILDMEGFLADLQSALVALDRAADLRNCALHELAKLKNDKSDWARRRLPEALEEFRKADTYFLECGKRFHEADAACYAAHARKVLHGVLRSPNGGERKI
jgi:hypothetical protein